jgi:hypothetical protein
MIKVARPYAGIEREQDAFNRRLTEMLEEHDGEFVLFRDEEPVAFFATYDQAYRAGLDRFGVDQTFLVSEVKRREAQTTSVAWEAGVMFQR